MASRARAGSAPAPQLALADVYREHFEFVWRSLRGLGFDASEAEDLAQDVFLVVRRRLADFDPTRPLRPWLFGIVRRVAKDRHRSRTRSARRLRLLPTGAAHGSPEADPERRAAAAQAASLVDGFLAELDEERRMLFILSEAEGLSGTELAEALGVNRNTIYTRLRALRRQFEAFIADQRS